MPGYQKIDQLVRLLGAESSRVKAAVCDELRLHIGDLDHYLEEVKPDYPPEILFELHELVRDKRSKQVRTHWLNWLPVTNEYERLEAALTYLTRIGKGRRYPGPGLMLDNLANDFLERNHSVNVLNLNQYLFKEGRLTGELDYYYHPDNINMSVVLSEGKGLPISLAAAFMLCGYRLGLAIQGFNLPGHFLARAVTDGETLLFDCYNRGKIIHDCEVSSLTFASKVNLVELLSRPPSAVEIVLRFLVNLINAYFRFGDVENYHLCATLLADLRQAVSGKSPPTGPISFGKGRRHYKRGDVVRHKRYGYRGVVVDFDLQCKASDAWYYAKQTQPDRNQPWYHVLVGDSEVTTYAAQSNLGPDPTGREIQHPLISVYFDAFRNGHYVRNDVPWVL